MRNNNDFIQIALNPNNVDRYYHRMSILRAIENRLNGFKGKLLDVGCGKMPYKEYILKNSSVTEYVGLDIENAQHYSDVVKPDITWDGKNIPCQDSSFECAFATEVMEHVPEPLVFLNEVYRILKTGGFFFFTVPFLWPLHETPHDEYRYTPFAMERLLSAAGFSDISITALGGWNASLGQMIGLWLKRSPLSGRKKRLLQFMALPVLKYLYKHDNQDVDFLRGPMITGITGCAYKK